MNQASRSYQTAALAEPQVTQTSPLSDAGAKWNAAIFYALIGVLLIPLWAFHYFPSEDAPAHGYGAVVAHDYYRPDRPRFQEFFELNNRLVPNWICPHLMPVLLDVFPVDIAEKIILSAYLILLPVSVRYALGAIRRRSAALAIVIIPFVPNYYYHEGFLDFCVSLPVFFFVVGYWLKHRRDFRPVNVLVLAGLLLLGFLCHLVPTALAGFFITILAITMSGGGIEARMRRLRPVILAGAPVALLALWFLISQRSGGPNIGYPYASRLARLKDLIRFQKAFASREAVVAGVNLALFAGVSLWLIWRRRGRKLIASLDAFLLIALICAALFMFAPDAGAGGTELVVRLALFPFLALLLWWGVQPLGDRAFARLRLLCTVVSGSVAVLLVASMCASYAMLTPYLRDVELAVEQVPTNSTLFVTSLPPNTTLGPDGRLLVHGPDVFIHSGYRQAGERGIAIINCMTAETSYHEIRFRPELNPGYHIMIDFTGHAARTGKPVDYVLVWTGGFTSDNPQALSILKQLHDGYDLIYTSPATGYSQLYRRRGISALSPPAVPDPAAAAIADIR